jgi:hypothetical protein
MSMQEMVDAYIPAGTKHAFVVETNLAKFLTFVAPAALAPFIDDLSVPAQARTLPPPPTAPLDVAVFAAVAAKRGQKTYGPPPAPST